MSSTLMSASTATPLYQSQAPAPTDLSSLYLEKPGNSLLAQAHYALGKLNGCLNYLPGIERHTLMLQSREALAAQWFKRKNVSLEQMLLPYAGPRVRKKQSYEAFQTFLHVLEHAVQACRQRKISVSMLLELYQMLQAEKQEQPDPKELMKLGNSFEKIVFVLNGAEEHSPKLWHLAAGIKTFEQMKLDAQTRPMLRSIICQMWMVQQHYLKEAALGLSVYWVKQWEAFQQALKSESEEQDEWLEFFLNTLIAASDEACMLLESSLELGRRIESRLLPQLGKRRDNGALLLEALWRKPLIYGHEVAGIIYSSPPTGYSLLKDLVRLGIVEEQTGYHRNQVYAFKDYLNLLGL